MKSAMSIIIVCIILLSSAACSSHLESDVISISRHDVTEHTTPSFSFSEISDYNALKAAVLELIRRHLDEGTFEISAYEGDIESDVVRICTEFAETEPLAVFAVSSISGRVTQIVSYFEAEIRLKYKRTKRQTDAIEQINSLSDLRSGLFERLESYSDEYAFLTGLSSVTDAEIRSAVSQLYYNNPMELTALPSIEVESFPEGDVQRIVEVTFTYDTSVSVLELYNASMSRAVRSMVSELDTDSEAAALYNLAVMLLEICEYDTEYAEQLSAHGVQTASTAAYGALVRGTAVGEGFAMAYKALCGEAGIDCEVVLGFIDGIVHAWNIVKIDGEYYHIDVAMSGVFGFESAFLKRDEDFFENYLWDLDNTKRCTGELRYEDIPIVTPEEIIG